MREIHYAGTSFITTAAIADAVADYAGELARRDGSEMIQVPGLRADGSGPGRFDLLIGPASQIVISDANAEEVELDGEDTIAEIARRREAMRSFPTTTGEWEHSSVFDEV